MVAISAQMSANLVSLMTVNDDMAAVQERLSTGKRINSVMDGAAEFFRAKTLTEKAQSYDPVNANINAALANVKVADKAINTMYDNLTGLLTSLRDARAKAITATAAAATNNANSTAYDAGTPPRLPTSRSWTRRSPFVHGPDAHDRGRRHRFLLHGFRQQHRNSLFPRDDVGRGGRDQRPGGELDVR